MGYRVDPVAGIRPIDQWRWLAAEKYTVLEISGRREVIKGPLFCTVRETVDGVVTEWHWREEDMPGFCDRLKAWARQRHGAMHAVRDALVLTEGQQRAGSARAKKLKAEAKSRDDRLRKVAKDILAIDGPMPAADLAEILADRGLGGYHALLRKLPKLLAPTK